MIDQVKIRMTDSVCIAKFAIIKPEVEIVFSTAEGDYDSLDCHNRVAWELTKAVEAQFQAICERADPQDFIMIKNSSDVDKRLKTYAELYLKRRNEKSTV